MSQVNLVTKCFVMNDRMQVLVLKRSVEDNLYPGRWDLAGGRVEYGEDPNVAVIREINEETGLVTTIPEIIFTSTENTANYILTMFYRSNFTAGEIVLSHEHSEYEWISIDEFMSLELPEKFHIAAERLL